MDPFSLNDSFFLLDEDEVVMDSDGNQIATQPVPNHEFPRKDVRCMDLEIPMELNDENYIFLENDNDILIDDFFGEESIELTLKPEDIMSRTYVFDGYPVIFCCSPTGQQQICIQGYVYGVDEASSNGIEFTYQCVNSNCEARVATSAQFSGVVISDTQHKETCVSDHYQIQLRCDLYDLRILAEFSDDTPRAIYDSFVATMSTRPGFLNNFPPFEMLENDLIYHNENKPMRIATQRSMLRLQNSYTAIKKSQALPPAICYICSAQLYANDTPSQDLLIEHVNSIHENSEVMIRGFTFENRLAFERWIREVLALGELRHPCRLKKFGVRDECMYYLCTSDGRHQLRKARSDIEERGSCTTFVRVRNFRAAQDGSTPVSIEYCFDHWIHNSAGIPDVPLPEQFLSSSRNPQQRAPGLMQDAKLERVANVASMGATAAVVSTRCVNTGNTVVGARSFRSFQAKPTVNTGSLVQVMPQNQKAHPVVHRKFDNGRSVISNPNFYNNSASSMEMTLSTAMECLNKCISSLSATGQESSECELIRTAQGNIQQLLQNCKSANPVSSLSRPPQPQVPQSAPTGVSVEPMQPAPPIVQLPQLFKRKLICDVNELPPKRRAQLGAGVASPVVLNLFYLENSIKEVAEFQRTTNGKIERIKQTLVHSHNYPEYCQNFDVVPEAAEHVLLLEDGSTAQDLD